VYVAEPSRRRGVASALTAAAEQRASERGHETLALEVSADNAAAAALYERLGYRPTGEQRRVSGTIMIRGKPMDVDDTIVGMKKPLER
jgi:ribosomal protein S18 acetylase RimI-like enzyme